MKRLFVIIVLLLTAGQVNSQDSYRRDIKDKLSSLRKSRDNHFSNLFVKVNPPADKMQSISFNYPLNNGDFWEYIEKDTLTFPYSEYGSLQEMNFSVIKEITGDTIMQNGLKYKIMKWVNYANSVNEPAVYEYQRKDSEGNIYTYYNNEDKILYDLRGLGRTYPSQFDGYDWRSSDKYKVNYLGKELNAIDFELNVHNTSTVRRYETLVENFGLIKYYGDINKTIDVLGGNFFGGVINDSTFGYLLARNQKIDWKEFYPLNIGDYWKYQGWSGSIDYEIIVRVIKDTLLADNKIYKVIESEMIGGPYAGKTFLYERFDSIKSVINWEQWSNRSKLKYSFSSCVGDTFVNLKNFVWRTDNKNYVSIKIFEYPGFGFQDRIFQKGFGLVEETFEGGMNYLVGAVIKGIVYGDTTITNLESSDRSISEYRLYQNYPNPFNPVTNIKYTLPQNSYVVLEVYNILGQKIMLLINEAKPAGYHEAVFSAGSCGNGSNLSSGIYIYRLTANSLETGERFIKSAKMMLMK